MADRLIRGFGGRRRIEADAPNQDAGGWKDRGVDRGVDTRLRRCLHRGSVRRRHRIITFHPFVASVARVQVGPNFVSH